jgi:hypothetical protein
MMLKPWNEARRALQQSIDAGCDVGGDLQKAIGRSQ